jgi:hypothetical protein
MSFHELYQLVFNVMFIGWILFQNRANRLVQAQIETLREHSRLRSNVH